MLVFIELGLEDPIIGILGLNRGAIVSCIKYRIRV